jgi:hypothetical protein
MDNPWRHFISPPSTDTGLVIFWNICTSFSFAFLYTIFIGCEIKNGVSCQLREDTKIFVVFQASLNFTVVCSQRSYMLQSSSPWLETFGLLPSNFFYPHGLISKYTYCIILQVTPEVHTKIVSCKPQISTTEWCTVWLCDH